MTDTLIARWNECVLPGDTVFHLGDFALSWGKKHAAAIDEILAQLNGRSGLFAAITIATR
jgi:calcineurin-like phosphoesterase family protein